MYLLGYIQRDSRIYLADKDVNVTSFALSLSVVEYQTLVLRGDMETAEELLPSIPQNEKNKIARFLEGQGHKELALSVATDSEHKFELALSLGELPIALELAREADVDHKWKTVGDAALSAWDVALAAECFTNAKDLGSLLLLYSSTGDKEGLKTLAGFAEETGAHNVAFTCLWQLSDIDGCIDLLAKTGRTPEAVLFSQTYKPSKAPETVKLWKQGLESNKKGRVAKILGVPGEDEDLFPEWEEYLTLEEQGGAVEVDGEAEEGDETAEVEIERNGANTDEVVNGDGPDPDAEAVEEGSLVDTTA